MKIALQMNHPSGLNYHLDSSLCLGREAARRGYTLYYLPPESVSQKGQEISGMFSLLTLGKEDGSREYTLGAAERRSLAEMDLVLIRQDPPFDMAYVTNLLMLEEVEKQGVRVLNRPRAIRDHIEKLSPLRFPEYTPPTLISADRETLTAFHREQGEVVLKPLLSYGGHGVFKINAAGENLKSLLEMMFGAARDPLVMQKFLPDVVSAEKRILLIDGAVAGAFQRIPAKGEIRANTRAGGGFAKTTLTEREQEIAATVGAFAKQEGLHLVGMDVIGGWLTEINVTSPTGLMLLKEIYGPDAKPEVAFWDQLSF